MVIKKHQEKTTKDTKSSHKNHKREPIRTSSSSNAKKTDTRLKRTSSKKSINPSQIQVLIGAAVVGLLVIILVIVVGLAFTSNGNGEEIHEDINMPEVIPETPITSEEDLEVENDFDPLTPILNINGEEVLAQDVAVVQMQLQQQGFEINEQQALEQIITNTVLLQAVQEQNFVITNEEAEEELIQLLSTQGFTIDDLKLDLEEQGVSYEATLEDFKERIAVDRFLEQNIDISSVEVTQEEVEEFYAMYSMQMGEQTLPFEEIELQIVAQIEQEKIGELQNQFINVLVEEADIEFY
ncbi:MAG: hypothetical protein ACMXYB_01390 [Candidatus Woesearchaeota archaeon]